MLFAKNTPLRAPAAMLAAFVGNIVLRAGLSGNSLVSKGQVLWFPSFVSLAEAFYLGERGHSTLRPDHNRKWLTLSECRHLVAPLQASS